MENDTNDIEGEKTIIGKWKLSKVTIPFTLESNDYSQYSIMYEFDTNGILTVSGKTDRIERYRGHEAGEYSYLITEEDYGQGLEGISCGLKIGNFSYWYLLSQKELIIDASPLDGYIYYLIKINP